MNTDNINGHTRFKLKIAGSKEPGDIFGQSTMKLGVMSQDVSAIITSLEQKVLDLNKENISFRKKASYMSLLGLVTCTVSIIFVTGLKNEILSRLLRKYARGLARASSNNCIAQGFASLCYI